MPVVEPPGADLRNAAQVQAGGAANQQRMDVGNTSR